MKIIVTSDDYGLTRGITDTILASVDRGAVTCVSLIANGDDFDRAIVEAKKRPEMQIAVHLNLTDGKPLAEIPGSQLIGRGGTFRFLFQTLWLSYVLSLRKKEFFEDTKKEICAQVKKIQQALPGRKIFLNGHDHIHMVPFVCRAVAAVADELGISYVRISDEPFFLETHHLSRYAGAGPVKWLLLKVLSVYARHCMTKARVQTPHAFVGVLFTGAMTQHVVRTAFHRIIKQVPRPDIVEVLFHPGKAAQAEIGKWPTGGRTAQWFFSSDRDTELAEVCNPELKIFFETLRHRT